MIQTFTFTIEEKDVPEPVRREALRTGKPLDLLVKEALLAMARRLNKASRPPEAAGKTA